MNAISLIAGLLLPWILGVALLLAVARREELASPGAIAWTLGAGYLAGAFLLTLWMRALSLVGVSFSVFTIGAPLLVAAIALGFLARRRLGGALRPEIAAAFDELRARELSGWRKLAWYALCAWLVLRFALLFTHIVAQPLYPWDAWIQWATKARVFYELGRIAPFGFADQWFASSGVLYFDASPHYPVTVPLLQVWTSVAYGRYDDVLMNLPWWEIAVSLALLAYGVLRHQGFGALGALAGTWIVASLPLANVHVALAGYADLPMAVYYATAALATLRALKSRAPADALIAILFLIACPTIKTPGSVWVLTLLPAVVLAFGGKHAMRIVIAGFATVLIALTVLAQTNPTVLGYRIELDFAPDWQTLSQTFFLLDNWHLLWYGLVAVAILGRRQWFSPELAPFTLTIASGFVFLFVVFGFTNARAWVADQTTINRAVLHIAPLAALWMLAVFRAWSATEARPVTSSVSTAADPLPP